MAERNRTSFVWIFVLVVILGLVAIAAIRFLPSQAISQRQRTADELEAEQLSLTPGSGPALGEVLGLGDDDFTTEGTGDVRRPKRDMAFEQTRKDPVESAKSPFPHPGNPRPAPSIANPEVAGLFAELSQDDRGPRAARSSTFLPEAFDLEKYRQDPEAWLSQIRPGRVYQPAQPGEGVQPIATKSPGFQRILQGEKVIFEAKVSPGAPVAFYTPQVGFFESQLKSQSVAADENGIARVVYTAGPGTNGLNDVIAASPMHSGQLRFRVKVTLPTAN